MCEESVVGAGARKQNLREFVVPLDPGARPAIGVGCHIGCQMPHGFSHTHVAAKCSPVF